MLIFRKIIATLFSIVFILLFSATIVLWGNRATTLNPNFIINSLNKANIYSLILNTAPQFLAQSFKNSDDNQNVTFTEKDVKSAMKDTVTVDYLKNNSEIIITNIGNYVIGKTDIIDVIINLKPIQTLRENLIKNAVNAKLNSLADCESDREFDPNELNCKPSQDKINDTLNQLLATSQDNNSDATNLFTSDSLDLGKLISQSGPQSPILIARQAFSYFNLILLGLTAACIVLLGLIWLLIFKPAYAAIKWIAGDILSGGIIITILGIAVLSSSAIAPSIIAGFPANVQPIAQAVIGTFVKSMGLWYLFAGLIFALISVGLYILSSKLNKTITGKMPQKNIKNEKITNN